jgi:uncharacterized membrane protein YidH (DUF202 family)
MNLDELKIQLNTSAESENMSAEKLANMLKRHPRSMIAGILKSLRMEIIFSILFTITCAYVAATNSNWSLRVYFGIFIIVGAAFAVVLSYLYSRTKKTEARSLPMKQNIASIINIIETYCRYYFRFSIALMPICIFLSVALGIADAGTIPARITNLQFIIPFGLLLLAICVGVYYINKWWLNRLYGRYVQQLKTYLHELEENEE